MKIYAWYEPYVDVTCPEPAVMACARAEDGTLLMMHVSSNPSWAMHDIGITSNSHHDTYAARYPGGFEMVWLGNTRPPAPEAQ